MYLARSKAGHDKGEVYVVLSEEEGYVFLVNGATKPVSRPKKKKKLHIQPILQLPAEVEELCREGPERAEDGRIRRILKLYSQRGEADFAGV